MYHNSSVWTLSLSLHCSLCDMPRVNPAFIDCPMVKIFNNNKTKIFNSAQNDARIGKDAHFMWYRLIKKTQGSTDCHSLIISSLHFAVWHRFVLVMRGEYPAWDVLADRSQPGESSPESVPELWERSGEPGDENEARSARGLLPALLGARTSSMPQGYRDRRLHQ